MKKSKKRYFHVFIINFIAVVSLIATFLFCGIGSNSIGFYVAKGLSHDKFTSFKLEYNNKVEFFKDDIVYYGNWILNSTDDHKIYCLTLDHDYFFHLTDNNVLIDTRNEEIIYVKK